MKTPVASEIRNEKERQRHSLPMAFHVLVCFMENFVLLTRSAKLIKYQKKNKRKKENQVLPDKSFFMYLPISVWLSHDLVSQNISF